MPILTTTLALFLTATPPTSKEAGEKAAPVSFAGVTTGATRAQAFEALKKHGFTEFANPFAGTWSGEKIALTEMNRRLTEAKSDSTRKHLPCGVTPNPGDVPVAEQYLTSIVCRFTSAAEGTIESFQLELIHDRVYDVGVGFKESSAVEAYEGVLGKFGVQPRKGSFRPRSGFVPASVDTFCEKRRCQFLLWEGDPAPEVARIGVVDVTEEQAPKMVYLKLRDLKLAKSVNETVKKRVSTEKQGKAKALGY